MNLGNMWYLYYVTHELREQLNLKDNKNFILILFIFLNMHCVTLRPPTRVLFTRYSSIDYTNFTFTLSYILRLRICCWEFVLL